MSDDHAKLSPSKRGRWSKCPGSVREEAKYPDVSGASPGAIDGTHSHTLLELCLKEANYVASSNIGRELTDHCGKFVVDGERAARVQIALDYVQSRKQELNNTEGISTAVVVAERKVNPVALVGRDDMKGTADIQIGSLHHGVFEIADLKDGMNPVAADSDQLRLYAVAALSMLHEENRAAIKTIRLTIIQPKASLKGQDPIRFVDLDATEFLQSEVPKLIAEGAATDDPNAPLIPGDEQCKYCNHKGACAALSSSMMEKSGIKFDNLDVAKDAANKQPTEMSDEQIKELVEAAPLLRQMLDGVEAEALRRMEAGQVIAGLKVVRGRGSRAWLFDEAEMAEKLKKFGLPKEVIWETKLVSPAKVEKIKWIKRDGSEKQLSERQLKTMSEEYIKKSDGKLTVASESDPRPAVTLNAAPMFSVVVELPSWLS